MFTDTSIITAYLQDMLTLSCAAIKYKSRSFTLSLLDENLMTPDLQINYNFLRLNENKTLPIE